MDSLFVIIFILIGFIIGLATGILISRFTTEKKERAFLKRMEIMGSRNNELIDEVKQVISFNNKLAMKNEELGATVERFIREY